MTTLCWLILLCASTRVWAQPPSLPNVPVPENPYSVSLLTFQPGEVYWQRFGHNALLVRNADTGQALVYNYGIFDFRQKNFFLNFARGHMTYRLDVEPLHYTLQLYRDEHRWVYEQVLNLTAVQRLALVNFLEWNVQPQNAEYRYDYFVSNCSTRVRDAIDQVLGGELRRQLQARATDRSYRYEATRLIAPALPLMIAMDLGLGPAADRTIDQWQQSFVPMALMDAVRELQLARAEGWLLRSDSADAPQKPPALLMPFALIGLVFGTALYALSRARRRTVARWSFALLASLIALLGGLGGLILLAGWGLSEHWIMWRNQNLLLLNPLSLLLLPGWIASARASWQPSRWHRRIALLVLAGAALSLVLLLLPASQQNLAWIALLLPIQLALALSLRRNPNP